jgi:peptidoglycan/LPS O-acetylase OafA/YrhL
VDGLKAVAALLIVLHHAVLHGPLALQAEAAAPALAAWLQQYGRYAVQVFLVVGGYLALAGLLRSRAPLGEQLLRRHLRLSLPFTAALLLTLGAHVLTADWLPAELPQDREGLAGTLLAHALLLHGVLGLESLSLGAWYLAIDWQLYALLAGFVALARRGWPLSLLLAAAVLAAAWGFNRWSEGEAWAPYFFAAYGLGALAALPGPRHRAGLLALAVPVALALAVDFRGRLLLALAVALALGPLRDRPPALPARLQALLQALGERSFALFLVHYAVLLLVNAAALAAGWQGGWWGVGLILLLSLAAAHAFHGQVEQRLARWAPRPRALLLGLPLAGGLLGLERLLS